MELLGLHLEQGKQVPPLGARILSSLILNGMKGTTFDQLVQELGASKSTISTNLTTLVAQHRVRFFTKPGDRKRYYYSAPGYVSRMIGTLMNGWQVEADLLAKVLDYKEVFNRNHRKDPITTHVERDGIEFISECTTFFTRLSEKYRSREEQYDPHAL